MTDPSSSAASSSYGYRRRTTDLSHLLDTSYSSSNSTVAERSRQKASPVRSTVQNDQSESSGRLRRVKIQSLKAVPVIEETTNPEVEFIIQVIQ